MKRSIGVLCCTLLLGIILLFNAEGELPLHWLLNFLRIQTSKAIVKDRCLILFNVKVVRKKLEFSCPKLVFQLKKGEVICHVQQALLKYGPYVFSHINGVIKRHHGSYKAFLELENRDISKIRIVCDPYVPKTFEKLADAINSLDVSPRSFSAQGVSVHISEKCIYDQMENATFDHMHANMGYGSLYIDGAWLKYSQKANIAKYQDLCLAPVCCCGSVNLKTCMMQQAFVRAQAVHEHLGDVTVSLCARDVSSEKPMPAYVQLQSGALNAEGNFSDLKRLELDSGFVKCTSSDLRKKWSWLRSYDFSFQQPLYLRFYGNRQYLNGVLDAKDVTLDTARIRHIYSTFKLENQEKFSWKACLYGEKMRSEISGFYDKRRDSGEFHCAGYIAPEFTYAFKRYLPDWWEPFFKQFRFNEIYPYANFSVLFKAKDPHSLCFGYTSVKNVHFKQSHVQQLQMNFGNCPGYCWLRINQLKTKENSGACEIHWPYDVLNSQKERWIFDGGGDFKACEWLHLLEDFIGESKKFEILKRFDPNTGVQAKFEGVVSSEPYAKEHITIGFKIPEGNILDFPVRDFSTDYIWNPSLIHVKNIRAKLFGESPIVADVSLQKEHFNFQFSGQNITTKWLFNHPIFQPWTKSIPKNNLETYDGLLDIDFQGEGKSLDPVSVSGRGHLTFQNPNLSEIHILGPLARLFSKKFKWLPVVSFNKLVSDFSFTEKQISTQKSMLLGPSTRADLRGHIDFPQQKIQGEIHFSFLDYKQINFPVMRHFVQIFQPISKGFSARISGTFSAPRWNISFNPFRFALPK